MTKYALETLAKSINAQNNQIKIVSLANICLNYKNQIINFNYTLPPFFDLKFLAIEYSAEILLPYFDSKIETLFEIVIRILLDQSFIIISESIEKFTFFSMGLINIIKPFYWPYTFIPYLQNNLKQFVESPVPYIIGIHGDKGLFTNYLKDHNISSNLIFLDFDKITIDFKNENNIVIPNLGKIIDKLKRFGYMMKSKI